MNPDGPHLETLIEQLLAFEGDLPSSEVINLGKGGETAKRLLESGRYDNEIKPIENVDYIFVRLGINDWFRCENLEKEFPVQLKAVFDRLKEDFPNAQIFPTTICRFGGHIKCVDINRIIHMTAVNEKLKLFDLYPAYNQFLLDNGENSLNVRNYELQKIPVKYHEWLKPYIYSSKRGDKVMVNDQSLDPLFGHLHGWYFDRHPNTAGYNLIAAETVKFLAPIIRSNNLP